MTTELTQTQRHILYGGADSIRAAVETGDLPRTPEVNAAIASRCLWQNPAMWEKGRWFAATWQDGARRGAVRVSRCVTPVGEVRFSVVSDPGDRWCDSLTEEEARRHLKSRRQYGQLVYLTEERQVDADRAYAYALTR